MTEDKEKEFLKIDLPFPNMDTFTDNNFKIKKEISQEQERKNRDISFNENFKQRGDRIVDQHLNGISNHSEPSGSDSSEKQTSDEEEKKDITIELNLEDDEPMLNDEIILRKANIC